jgi:hypothetical protein
MAEKLTYKFDRLRWLEAKGFLSRKTIFLDLSFWIGMAEGQSPSYIKLKGLLSKRVAERQVICPVSPSLLLELKKRPSSKKRAKYCQLMDELSLGLSIRHWLVIFKEEFKSVAEERRIEPQIAYSHFVDALSASMRVGFENAWPETDASRASNAIFDYVDKMTIGEIVEIEVDEGREGSITFLRNGLSQLAQHDKTWRQNHSDSWSTIEQAEFAATVRAVLPQITRALTEIALSSSEKLAAASIKEKAEVLNQCPTFWCQHKLTTALRSNRVEINENDLWDLEHVASTVPYVNCLACDSGTRHLCSEVLKLDSKYGTTTISDVDDLVEWVQQNQNP